jgi:hypothetical protein
MKPISKFRYLGVIIGGICISMPLIVVLLLIYAEGRGADRQVVPLLMIPAVLPLLLGIIMQMKLLYKMWTVIEDGSPRTTPGKSVGLLFVPFFNLYWMFQAYWGWTKDYNRYVAAQRLAVPRASEALALAFCILAVASVIPWIGIVFGLINLVVLVVFLNGCINCVNGLAVREQGSDTLKPASLDRMDVSPDTEAGAQLEPVRELSVAAQMSATPSDRPDVPVRVARELPSEGITKPNWLHTYKYLWMLASLVPLIVAAQCFYFIVGWAPRHLWVCFIAPIGFAVGGWIVLKRLRPDLQPFGPAVSIISAYYLQVLVVLIWQSRALGYYLASGLMLHPMILMLVSLPVLLAGVLWLGRKPTEGPIVSIIAFEIIYGLLTASQLFKWGSGWTWLLQMPVLVTAIGVIALLMYAYLISGKAQQGQYEQQHAVG